MCGYFDSGELGWISGLFTTNWHLTGVGDGSSSEQSPVEFLLSLSNCFASGVQEIILYILMCQDMRCSWHNLNKM